MLGGLRDRLVLRRELRDRPPLLLLRSDSFEGGEFSADVLHDSVEYGPGGGIGVIAWVGLAVSIVGSVDRDVSVIGISPAGHRDIEIFPRCCRGYDGVCGVGRDSLCPVCRDGVAEVPQTHSPMIVRVRAFSCYLGS